MSDVKPQQNLYGIHWDQGSGGHALWQLTTQDYLRVDVTARFESRYRIVAYTDLDKHTALAVREAIDQGKLRGSRCGNSREGYKGYEDDIFEYVSPPYDSGLLEDWRVTNCARLVPGFVALLSQGMRVGENISKHFTTHPEDGYSVQFNAVPWDVFTRYWRKPVRPPGHFHGKTRRNYFTGGKTSPKYRSQAVDLLEFDLTLLRSHKVFFADFSYLYKNRRRTHDDGMAKWILDNVRGFSFLTDAESPFVYGEEEALFSLECM